MQLIGMQVLHEFIKKHVDARSNIESWKIEAEEAHWTTPHELKGKVVWFV